MASLPDVPADVDRILTPEQKAALIESRKQAAETKEQVIGADSKAQARAGANQQDDTAFSKAPPRGGANQQDDTGFAVVASRTPDSPPATRFQKASQGDSSAIQVYGDSGRPPGQYGDSGRPPGQYGDSGRPPGQYGDSGRPPGHVVYHPPPQTQNPRYLSQPQPQSFDLLQRQQEPSQQLLKRKHQPQPPQQQQQYMFHQNPPQQVHQQGHRPQQLHQQNQRFLTQQNQRLVPQKAVFDRGYPSSQWGPNPNTPTMPSRLLDYESQQTTYDSQQNLDSRFYTADQRLVLPRKGYQSASNRVDETAANKRVGVDETPLTRVQETGDKRTLSYWEKRGLPIEGILLNKKMYLCGLTPDRVLFKYFTKVQGSLVPDRPMDKKMQENMEVLYEKIFERPLSLLDGKVSMKFGRAFIAQELKKKRFNWAQYAMSEYIRIADRNAKKALAFKRRQSKPLVEPDHDAEGEGDWDGEGDGDGDGDAEWEVEDEGLGGEGNDVDDVKLHTQYQVSGPAEEVELGESDHHAHLPYTPTTTTPSDTQTYPHLRGKLDEAIQELRVELQRGLMLTHFKDEMLGEFDRCVVPYLSEKSKLEQEKADLNEALILAENKCKLLEADLYSAKGKKDMESFCVHEGIQSLQALVARKPVESTDPESVETNVAAAKKWMEELKEGCMHVGYSKHGVQEQEKAYNNFSAEHAAASAERIALTKKLNQLQASRSNEDTEDGSNKRLKL